MHPKDWAWLARLFPKKNRFKSYAMITDALLSKQVIALEPELTAAQALEKAHHTRFSQLPLVRDGQYLCLIEEFELEGMNPKDQTLSKFEIHEHRPYLESTSHPFEAFRLVHEQDLEVLPILDQEGLYLGSVTLRELIRYAAENSGWDMPGGIVVLMVPTVQYSLHRLSLVCEEESLTILGVQVRSHAQGGLTEVTLKLNRQDLDGLVQALERHGYRIMEVYGDQPRKEEMMTRYQLLMNYINM